jgi:hypothetical protein
MTDILTLLQQSNSFTVSPILLYVAFAIFKLDAKIKIVENRMDELGEKIELLFHTPERENARRALEHASKSRAKIHL